MWVVTHPLRVVSGDDLENLRLHVTRAHERIRTTRDHVGRGPEVRAATAHMRRTLETAIADQPVDRCELDELIAVAVDFGSWRRARQGADAYSAEREHWIDLTTRMIAGTTEEDDEPIDADEIFAILAERDELRGTYGHLMPQRIRAVGFAAETLMRHWVQGLPAVLASDLLAVEAGYRANHTWWIRTYGEDPLAGARAQHLALFRRMRRQIERTTSLAGGRNFPQSAPKTALDRLTNETSREANSVVGSPPMPTTTTLRTGTKLRKARERAGLSRRELAEQAHVTRWQLLQWENGDHTPSLVSLAKIVPHLGGKIDDYL